MDVPPGGNLHYQMCSSILPQDIVMTDFYHKIMCVVLLNERLYSADIEVYAFTVSKNASKYFK